MVTPPVSASSEGRNVCPYRLVTFQERLGGRGGTCWVEEAACAKTWLREHSLQENTDRVPREDSFFQLGWKKLGRGGAGDVTPGLSSGFCFAGEAGPWADGQG